jgi:hypothetical protein
MRRHDHGEKKEGVEENEALVAESGVFMPDKSTLETDTQVIPSNGRMKIVRCYR